MVLIPLFCPFTRIDWNLENHGPIFLDCLFQGFWNSNERVNSKKSSAQRRWHTLGISALRNLKFAMTLKPLWEFGAVRKKAMKNHFSHLWLHYQFDLLSSTNTEYRTGPEHDSHLPENGAINTNRFCFDFKVQCYYLQCNKSLSIFCSN